MNYSGMIRKTVVLSISLLLGFLVTTKSAICASAPVISNMPEIVDGASTPVRILLDATGNSYVSDPRGGGIIKYDRYGKALVIYPVAKDVIGMAFPLNFSTSNELLITHGNTIARLNLGTGQIVGTFGSFKQAHGIAVDAAGFIYVTDSLNDCVQKFDASFNPVTLAIHNVNRPVNSFGVTGSLDRQFLRPAGITYEKISGQLAVVDSLNGRVQFFTASGTWVSTLGSFGSGSVGTFLYFTMPKSIAFEYAGSTVSRYYIADSFQSNVQVIDAATKSFLSYIGSYGYVQGGLISPSDVQIDQSNLLTPTLIVANEIGLLTSFGIDSLLPTNVKVLPATIANQLTLNWTNPGTPTFDSVRIYRSPTPGGVLSPVGGRITGVAYPGTSSYTDTGLSSGTAYYYTVRGVNASAVETTNTDQVSGTTQAALMLTVNQTGTGNGTVTSSGLTQPTLSFTNGVYTESVNSGSSVTLTALHNTSSVFTKWTGTVCNNSTNNSCTFTMNDVTDVTANFDLQHVFALANRGLFADNLQDIYSQANSGDTIMAMTGTSPAFGVGLTNMTANNTSANPIVTVIGGYDSDYTISSGVTVIQGRVNIKAGKVIFKNIKISQ